MTKSDWAFVVATVLMIGSAIFVGIVKFMAWWNIATGGCS